jgi:Fatty acid hydroxylase superfamily
MARCPYTFCLVMVALQCMYGRSFAFDIGSRGCHECDAYRRGAPCSLWTNSIIIFPNLSFLSSMSHREPRQPVHLTKLRMSRTWLPKVMATLPEQYELTASKHRVPTTMSGAIKLFFSSKDIHGPRLVVVLLLEFLVQRIQLGWPSAVTPWDDLGVAMIAVLFWWLQEHVMHKNLLHSDYNWIGQRIHQEHHEKPYHHVSIDPAPLMLGWFTIVHLLLRYGLGLPLHLALTATMAYGVAGLFYEWTHFIVHTRVRFPHGSYWEHVKNHHARHHLVNNSYWFAFSLTQVDDIFGTNPPVSKSIYRQG